MTTLKRTEGRIALSAFGLDSIEKLTDAIHDAARKQAEEILRDSLTSEKVRIDFPVLWNPETKNRDPLSIDFRVEIGSNEDGVTFRFSLRDVVSDNLDGATPDGMARVSDALKGLARTIDRAAGGIVGESHDTNPANPSQFSVEFGHRLRGLKRRSKRKA